MTTLAGYPAVLAAAALGVLLALLVLGQLQRPASRTGPDPATDLPAQARLAALLVTLVAAAILLARSAAPLPFWVVMLCFLASAKLAFVLRWWWLRRTMRRACNGQPAT